MVAIAIDPARVRELLTYDPATGELRWRKPQCPRIKVGDLAGGLKSNDPALRYWVVKMDGRRYRRARLVWAYVHGESPPDEVDHRDRDKTNDRIKNLRPATRSQNGTNAVHPKTIYPDLPRGVAPKRRNGRVVGYRGRAEVQGRKVEVGPCATPEQASAALTQALVRRGRGAEWLPDPLPDQGPCIRSNAPRWRRARDFASF